MLSEYRTRYSIIYCLLFSLIPSFYYGRNVEAAAYRWTLHQGSGGRVSSIELASVPQRSLPTVLFFYMVFIALSTGRGLETTPQSYGLETFFQKTFQVLVSLRTTTLSEMLRSLGPMMPRVASRSFSQDLRNKMYDGPLY